MLITHYMFLNLNSRTTKTINSKKMKLKAVPKLLYNRTTNQHKREKRGRETYWPSCFLLDTPPLPKYLFSSLAWGESQRVTVDAVATSADSEATKEMCNKYKTLYKKLHPYTLKHWWLTRPRRKRSITIFVPIITFPRKLKLIFRQVSSAEQNYTRENSFRPLKFWPGALHASCGFGIKCDARSVDGSCKMNFIPLYLLFPSIILLFLYLLYFHSPYFHSPHTHTPKYIRAFSTYTTTPYSLQAYRKTCNLIIFLRQPLRGDSSQFCHDYYSLNFAWFLHVYYLPTWIYNFGSSHHMTPNLSLLSHCVSPASPISIATANGTLWCRFYWFHPLYFIPFIIYS